ncbi:MAG: serine hydrolase domain-containing protein [Gemmatimonadota bacterium]|nr:serine hydrolase domain-containing protein [Gemmatimonadota bacterium]
MRRSTPRPRLALVVLAVLAACAPGELETTATLPDGVHGPALPMGSATTAGLGAPVLAEIVASMQTHVDAGRLPGAMTLIARGGEIVHWSAVGMRDIESGDPLHPDDIFRIYSMTKPITSVAVMMLVESGAVALDDPVSDYIPGFADLTVLEEDGSRAPLERPITIRHLLTHTSGLTYGLFGDTPADRAYMASDLFGAGSLEEYIGILEGLPLLAQPGERWNYSVSTDVLGYVVQVASGRPFGEFLDERIFGPLGMDDTAFWVPEEKRDRFTTHYRTFEAGLEVVDSPAGGRYTRPPGVESGGGGLVSTASDYVRFAQMLLQEGELDGVRLLRSETVRTMRTNQLADDLTPIAVAGWIAPAYGFGLGFATLLDQDVTPWPDHDGMYRWGGLANTFFWIDPVAGLIAMVWTQVDPFLVHGLERSFEQQVYAALDQAGTAR